jgi:acetyl-CoA acetyltransferase
MPEAFICAALRTPIGRYGGSLSSVRPDDLGAVPLKALMERHSSVDWAAVDDVIFGCANQAGEDNRNPLGMSGARLIATATHEMQERGLKRALATMCIGVGQGIATVLERV